MRTDRFYAHPLDHLTDEIARLDVIIGSEIERMNAAGHPDNELDAFRGMFMTESEAVQMLGEDERLIRLTPEEKLYVRQIDNLIAERIIETEKQGRTLPLHRLQQIYRFGDIEKRMLIAAIAPHLHRKYLKLYAYLQDDMTSQHLTVDLLLRLCCSSLEERTSALNTLLDNTAPIRDLLLIDPLSGQERQLQVHSILSCPVRLDQRVVYYIHGLEWRHEGALQHLTAYQYNDGLAPMLNYEHLHDHMAAYTKQRLEAGSSIVWMIHGPAGSGKTHLSRLVAGRLGQALLEWDVAYAPEDEESFLRAIDGMLREAKLLEAVPAFANLNALRSSGQDPRRGGRLDLLMKRLTNVEGVLFLSGEEELKAVYSMSQSRAWHTIGLDVPDLGARTRLWRNLAGSGINEQDAAELAGKFRFTPGMITAVIEAADKLAGWQSASSGSKDESNVDSRDGMSRMQLLNQTSYQLINHRLSDMAVKIEPKFHWDDLILPPHTKRLLEQAAGRLKFRYTVMDEWGFDRKLPYGKGISMLFTGPPGTGKTMSAMVMAKQMRTELYRIDLSRVVSKYIGETEKNLSHIFDQAKLSGAILFFDEADALFGKRSEVKDSHDKYANMETSYLLQKMEEYDGLTILATNFSQNLDDAFTRRIQFIIKFPFPDAEQREQLWRSSFPEQVPKGDIDYAYLAGTFELAGGPIKNIVLTAAYLAAEESEPVSMKHLLEGVIQEYKKSGKVLLKDRLGAYAEYWKG